MDLIPAEIVTKQIANINEFETEIQKHKTINKFNLTSEFVSSDKSIVFEDDDDIIQTLKNEIIKFVDGLPHKRIVLFVDVVDSTVEITVNPVTCTA
jgi:hypothetical protein